MQENCIVRRKRKPRRGTIYVAVLGVAVIIAIIGLMSLAVIRIERRAATANSALIEATLLAQSGVEQCISVIGNDSSWRSTYTHDVWQTPINLGNGNFQWKLIAASGDLTSPYDGATSVVSRGTVNESIQELGVTLEETLVVSNNQVLRSYTNASSTLENDVMNSQWFGQYFMPALPPGATSWQVTSVELRLKKMDGGRNLDVRLYQANGSNMPGTLVDSVSEDSTSLASQFEWHEFAFSGHSGLDPSTGLVVTLETTDETPARFEYESGSVSESNSAFITGNPTWITNETDKALYYKIHGTYSTGSTPNIVAGTWTIE